MTLTRTPLRRTFNRKRASAWALVTTNAIADVRSVCPVKSPGCIGRATQGHHKLARSAGGKDTAENCLPLCGSCHRFLHEHPRLAMERGWILSRYARDVGR